MIKKWNKYYYTLIDMYRLYQGGTITYYSTNYIAELLEEYVGGNTNYGLSHSPTEDTIMNALFVNIFARYRNEYVFASVVDLEEHPDVAREYIQEWLLNLLSKTIDEEEYYYTMLSMYESNKAKLMDSLKRANTSQSLTSNNLTDTNTLNTTATNTVDLENTNNTLNRYNDTPNYRQTTEQAYTGFGYTTQIGDSKSTGTQTGTSSLANTGTTTLTKTGTVGTEVSGSDTHDVKYIYEKLFEIQKDYKDLFGDWLKSYRAVFIESYNI